MVYTERMNPTETPTVYGLINSAMFGAATEPGEHVEWSTPDYYVAETFTFLGLGDPATYAAENPHMIVFVR